MPRRRAPLLIFFYLILAHAQNPTPQNTHAPVKVVAVPHPDVFIPLKEWKQRRLQHLESRVREAEQKRAHPRRGLLAVCKPRARLLAFLARLDICPPTPTPTTPQSATPSDPYWVSATHAYGDANRSVELTRAAPIHVVQPSTDHSVSSSPVEQPADSHVPLQSAVSVEPSLSAESMATPQPSSEPDELTGRIEDYIPKVLPKVLPNVIPKVNEIVKSLKEASLVYTTSGEAPADSLKPGGKSSGSANCNSTGNSTSQEPHQENPVETVASTFEGRARKAPAATDMDTADLLQDDRILGMIVKHNNDTGVKEKPFNYASVDAGARVLACSEGVVGAKNVIQGSDDKYLLSPCAGSGFAGSRFVDLELSEEVILESVETGNFEYYSSAPRNIAVLGSSTYPPKKWNVLGIFDFANVKTLQKFQIQKRAVTRYLRVIFAGKQGNEYYCPISTVRAFGKNLLADWKEVMEKPSGSRKPLNENGGGSRSKLEKETDKAGNANGRNGKRSDAPSVRTENASREDAISPASTASENSTADGEAPATVSNEGSRGENREPEHTRNNEAGTVDDGQAGNENEKGHFDGASSSNAKSEEVDNEDGENEAEEASSGEDGSSGTNHASYGDGDHVSEDDQVVIDALRSDTLAPVDGDDNIFRKVTRMLRVLELNQTLTNQYIDTQLAKFAVALSDSLSNSRNATERVEGMQRQLEVMVVRLENQIDELTRANFTRDVFLCVLIVCVAFLLGTHWILWSTVSGAKLSDDSGSRISSRDIEADRVDRMLQTEQMNGTSLSRIEGISSEGPSPAGKKKKRKDRKKPHAGQNMNGGFFTSDRLLTTPPNGADSGTDGRTDGRSISSVEISTNHRRRFTSGGGSFDILGKLMDQ